MSHRALHYDPTNNVGLSMKVYQPLTTCSLPMFSPRSARTWGALLRLSVPVWRDAKMIDPYSAALLEHVPDISIAPAALLAVTRCRWAELLRFPLEPWAGGRSVRVEGAKRGKTRTIRGADRVTVGILQPALRLRPVWACSLAMVQTQIVQAISDAGYQLPARSHGATHAFRHFWATWQRANGCSVSEISEGLGHYRRQSTEAYIHDPADLVGTLIT
jgi:integrase